VLRHLRRHAPCSRADIAGVTGLTKATVSSLVAELLERRLVRETGLTEHRVGRPATMLTLDGGSYAALGMEIGPDHLSALAVDVAGDEVLNWRRASPGLAATPGRAATMVAALAARAVSRITAQGRQVLGLTVGVPGLVDGEGDVSVAIGLGWRDVPLRTQLVTALRDPAYEVRVENAANLAVLAEHRDGPHAGTANLVHLTAGAGMGAGIVVDGRRLHGGRGFAGEFGHLPLDPAGPLCPCGRRGCLEAIVGIGALLRRALPDAEADGPMGDFAPEVDRVVSRARYGDPGTLAALHETGRWLGRGVSLLANLVNPEIVLLGGLFVPLAPWLLPPAQEELASRSVAPDGGGCRILASALGAGAVARGGASWALAALDAGQLPGPARDGAAALT
jgi:predicted NBD/HSP70 family sugar kinase